MTENTEELGSEETPQTRAGTPRNFSIGDIRDGSNIFTFVMEQLHTIAEGMNELHQRLSALEQLQGKYGNVVADSVDAQSVKVGGVDVMPQGGDYAPKNHASAQTTYGQATTSNYGHSKLSNDTLNANSTGTAGVACSTGHKHSQYIEKSATSGLVKNDGTIDTTNYSTTDTKDTVGTGTTNNIVTDAGKTFYIPFVLQNSGTPKSYTAAKINNANFDIMGVYFDYMYGLVYPVVNGKNVPVYDDSVNEEGKVLVIEGYQLKSSTVTEGSILKAIYLKNGALEACGPYTVFHRHNASSTLVRNATNPNEDPVIRVTDLENNAYNVVTITEPNLGPSKNVCSIRINLGATPLVGSENFELCIHLRMQVPANSRNSSYSVCVYFEGGTEDGIYPVKNEDSSLRQYVKFGYLGSETRFVLDVKGMYYQLHEIY